MDAWLDLERSAYYYYRLVSAWTDEAMRHWARGAMGIDDWTLRKRRDEGTRDVMRLMTDTQIRMVVKRAVYVAHLAKKPMNAIQHDP